MGGGTAKESPCHQKLHSDIRKFQAENKIIIDNYLSKSFDNDIINYIQICGFELFILNLSLKAPDLDISTEIYQEATSKALSRLPKYFDLAIQLLYSCVYMYQVYSRSWLLILVWHVKDKYVEPYNVQNIHLFNQKSFKLNNREEGEEEGKVGRKINKNVGKTGPRFVAR